MNTVKICENGVQAKTIIEQLTTQGFEHDHIYLFTHDSDRTEDLAEATGAETVGMSELGVLDSVGNIFKKRGDELRAEFEAVGLTHEEAEKYERVLDEGQVVIVAVH